MTLHEWFDHQAAMAAAIQLRNALRRHRWRLAVSSVLASVPQRAEINRAASDLLSRESALQAFLENPYAQNSLFRMRAEDRSVMIDAGTAETVEERSA